MGFIRGTAVTILTVLLFLSLLSTAVLLTVTLSLNYEYVNPELTAVIDQQIRQGDAAAKINEGLQGMQIYCQNETVFVQKIEDRVFEIPCETIDAGSEAVISYAIDDIVESNYYKEYTCKFSECFDQEGADGGQPLFVFSKFTHDYAKSWSYKAFWLSILFIVGLFFFMEDKHSLPFLTGIISLVVSLPFLGIGKILSWVLGWEYFQIAQIFVTKSYTVFMIFFIVGMVLIALGIVLKFLSVGRWFGNLFKSDKSKVSKKDIKDAVKEEVKASKPKKKKK